MLMCQSNNLNPFVLNTIGNEERVSTHDVSPIAEWRAPRPVGVLRYKLECPRELSQEPVSRLR